MTHEDGSSRDREIAAHLAVADALAAWDGVDAGTARLLAGLAGALDSQAGVLWVPDGDLLKPRVFWEAGVDLREFRMMTLTSRLRRGVELPGQAWQCSEPRVLSASARGSPRWRAAAAAGMNGAVALPAVGAGDALAVVELAGRRESDLTDEMKRSLTAIGYVLGEFLMHRRGLLNDRMITDRQMEILQLAAHGLSTRQIAEQLVVSPATVKTHLVNIYRRLGVPNKVSAVAEALRIGLVS